MKTVKKTKTNNTSKLSDPEFQKPFFNRCNNLYYFISCIRRSVYLKALLAEPKGKSSTTQKEKGDLFSRCKDLHFLGHYLITQPSTPCTEHGCSAEHSPKGTAITKLPVIISNARFSLSRERSAWKDYSDWSNFISLNTFAGLRLRLFPEHRSGHIISLSRYRTKWKGFLGWLQHCLSVPPSAVSCGSPQLLAQQASIL